MFLNSSRVDTISIVNLPVRNGLRVWQDMDSWNDTTKTWIDKSGNGYHTSSTTGVSVVNVTGGNGTPRRCLTGGTTSRVYWPSAMTATNCTLFFVSRWTGVTNQRILTNTGAPTWLVGHHSSGAGVAYSMGSNATTFTNYHGNNWVVSMYQNQPDLYHSNGINRPFGNTNQNNIMPSLIGINIKSDGEQSTWYASEFLLYNRKLTTAEITAVEKYLCNKHGMVFGV